MGRLARAAGVGGRAPQSTKLPRLGDADTHASHMCQSPLGVFFFIAFSFAPASAKEKANGDLIFPLAVSCTWGHGRGEHCSPAMKHKETFLLSYFSVTKSTKSHQRERSPLFENSSRVHESVARAMRGKCVRQRDKSKIGSFAALRNLILPRVRT